LHYILHQEKESLLYRVLSSQKANPFCGDWYLTVVEDIKELELNLSLEQYQKFLNFPSKNFLKSRWMEKKSKTSHISHKDLKLQPHLRPGKASNLQRKFLFQLRASMVDLKANYQGSHSKLECELCGKHIERPRILTFL
jgi:hypothetical protein